MLRADTLGPSCIRGGRRYRFPGVAQSFLAYRRMMQACCSFLLLCALAVLAGCATTAYHKPGPPDEAALRARAQTAEEDGIRVSALIPDAEEARALFGVDLATKEVQPVWLEIENNTERRIAFLPTGLDPEYFSPLEVAFGFHKEFSRDSRALLDAHIESLGFEHRIEPHSRRSGFVFTNVDRQSKLVTVDLVGNRWTKSFTLVVPTPDRLVKEDYYERLEQEIANANAVAVDDMNRLRGALETLPCCVTDPQKKAGAPLNLVLVGNFDDMGAAFIRRNYRVSPLSARYALGRAQDISAAKHDRWVPAQPLHLRAWMTNIRFRGDPVWVGQVSMPLAGRFASSPEPGASLPLDPDVDEARNALVADMIFSQGLVKLGFLRGAGGGPGTSEPDKAANADAYHTDGLRAVMFFERKPVAISQIQFLDWERPADYVGAKTEAVGSSSFR